MPERLRPWFGSAGREGHPFKRHLLKKILFHEQESGCEVPLGGKEIADR